MFTLLSPTYICEALACTPRGSLVVFTRDITGKREIYISYPFSLHRVHSNIVIGHPIVQAAITSDGLYIIHPGEICYYSDTERIAHFPIRGDPISVLSVQDQAYVVLNRMAQWMIAAVKNNGDVHPVVGREGEILTALPVAHSQNDNPVIWGVADRRKVTRIDLKQGSSEVVFELPQPHTALSLAASETILWVGSDHGTLWQIDVQSNREQQVEVPWGSKPVHRLLSQREEVAAFVGHTPFKLYVRREGARQFQPVLETNTTLSVACEEAFWFINHKGELVCSPLGIGGIINAEMYLRARNYLLWSRLLQSRRQLW
ncbi:MAG: hypothetical protein QXS54_04825 [Candidatus Methanomethylicaceae archaeon]